MLAFVRCWLNRHEPQPASIEASGGSTVGRCRHCGRGIRLNSREAWVRRRRRGA